MNEKPTDPSTEERADTPQSVAIAALIDLSRNSLDDEVRLEAARLLLNR